MKLTPKIMIIFQDEDSVLDLEWERRASHIGRRENSPAIKQRHYKQLGEGRGEGSGMYSSRSWYFTVATTYKWASTNKMTACLMWNNIIWPWVSGAIWTSCHCRVNRDLCTCNKKILGLHLTRPRTIKSAFQIPRILICEMYYFTGLQISVTVISKVN